MYGMNKVVLSGETRVVVCGMQHVSVQFFKINNIKKYELLHHSQEGATGTGTTGTVILSLVEGFTKTRHLSLIFYGQKDGRKDEAAASSSTKGQRGDQNRAETTCPSSKNHQTTSLVRLLSMLWRFRRDCHQSVGKIVGYLAPRSLGRDLRRRVVALWGSVLATFFNELQN
jgi:hypothetical protein